MSTIRTVSLAAERYAEALEALREADDIEDKARRAVDDLNRKREAACGYRKTLERVMAEALKAEEIP